jgi:hypothetical protein
MTCLFMEKYVILLIHFAKHMLLKVLQPKEGSELIVYKCYNQEIFYWTRCVEKYTVIIIHIITYSLFVLCITLNVALCRPNFEEIASYMKGWAYLAYRLRKTLNTLHTTKLKTLEHEKENDSQYKKSRWTFSNK